MRYRFIQQFWGQFSVAALCWAMQVSPQGYYAWKRRPPSPCAKHNVAQLSCIRAAHQQSRRTYGSPRVYHELRAQGVRCGRHRVARLMRADGLRAWVPKRFLATTDSRHALPLAPNLLNRQFGAQRPDAKWAGDIKYIWTGAGRAKAGCIWPWCWTCFPAAWWAGPCAKPWSGSWSSRICKGPSGSGSRPQACCATATPSPAVTEGSQYASAGYQSALAAAAAATGSMSRKGDCWDNAPIESFLATLKRELVHRVRFAMREAARAAVFEWIEAWYNRKRRHSALGYLSPEAFEQQHRQETERDYAMTA